MMDKFFTWLQKNDGYTNDSTGFHMGVSMPEQDTSSVDFTKLALFLGDKYVLDEFGRMGNIYCKSALGKIENRVKEHEIDPKLALDALRGGLDKLASGILANNEGFGKFTTINPKQKYIEFRTAGGEDYSEDITKLQNTLGRYAQAMYIASHPDMYRTEYQKKMYKLLSESEDSTDTIKELSKLSAGKTSDQDIQTWYSHMKEVLKKSETKRVATKGNKLMVWSVSTKRNPHVSADVFAMSGDEAIEIARLSLWLRTAKKGRKLSNLSNNISSLKHGKQHLRVLFSICFCFCLRFLFIFFVERYYCIPLQLVVFL
jgi:hypothetical protein